MHGLYLLWWVQEKHMSPAIVGGVIAAGDLALMLLELPTGWFADRLGHRVSLIVGSLLQTAGMLLCWLGEGVSGLVAAAVLVALADGFRSGADEALLYRTCLALNREENYQKIEARTDAIALGSLVALVLAGGAIVHVGGFAWGWLAETALCAIGVALAYGMVEPPAQRDAAETHTRDADQPGDDRRRTPYGQLAAMIVPCALLNGAADATSFLAQTHTTAGPVTMTLLVAIITGAQAAGCAYASHRPAGTLRTQVQLLVAGAIMLAAALANPALLALASCVLAFLVGVGEPLRATGIQRIAADHIRARAASAASACDMAINTVVLPLAGLWQTRRRR